MKIQEVMTSEIQILQPHCNIQEAARKMKDLDVSALPVGNEEALLGIVTDRDIAFRIVATGRDAHKTSVREIMSSPISYCYAHQNIEEAARIMENQKSGRLAVLDEDQHLVGVVSLGDIVFKTGQEDLVGEIIKKASKSRFPHAHRL